MTGRAKNAERLTSVICPENRENYTEKRGDQKIKGRLHSCVTENVHLSFDVLKAHCLHQIINISDMTFRILTHIYSYVH